jgi:hypothetical protein
MSLLSKKLGYELLPTADKKLLQIDSVLKG